MNSVKTDKKRERALYLLRSMAEHTGRTPKRQDFAPTDYCLIKQKLGPLPRALEAAGLKAVTKQSSAEKNRIKRAKAKAARKKLKMEESKNEAL